MKYPITLFAVLLFAACETKSRTVTSNFSRQYADKRSVAVVREDIYSETYGLITHTKYGEDHQFRYKLEINPGDHQWEGTLGQVPHRILFCREDILLQVSEQVAVIDTLHPEVAPVLKDTIFFYRNVDKRYFFRLFGEQYFEPVEKPVYLEGLTRCKEEGIPIG